jgi:uncharacterized protein
MQTNLAVSAEETRSYLRGVYGWMCFGLLISGATAFTVGTHASLYMPILYGPFFWPIMISELALVLGLAIWIRHFPPELAVLLFSLYCFMTGLTLSVIFLVYETSSIGQMFFVSAGMFGAMSAYGYLTSRDLTGLGAILTLALFGIVIASLVNLFIRNDIADIVTTVIGVFVFTGLTAYDTQKIKNQNMPGNAGTPEDVKESILGALTLYLDFVNLFLKMLRFFGKRK